MEVPPNINTYVELEWSYIEQTDLPYIQIDRYIMERD